MSREYLVEVSESISVRVHVDVTDSIAQQVSLLPILDSERMAEVLAEVLAEEGWTLNDKGKTCSKKSGGAVMDWDLEAMEVRTTLSKSEDVDKDVSARASRTVDRYTEDKRTRDEISANLRESLEESREAIGDRLREKAGAKLGAGVRKELIDGLQERTEELNEVIQEVYARSLKEKARTMGSVIEEEESRDENGYRLTIRIEE